MTDDDYLLQECHRMTVEVKKALKNGTIDTILISANETPLETVKVLRKISPKWVESLTVSAVQNNTDKCLVFLTPNHQTSGSISFLFKNNPAKKQLQPKRIDLIDYQQFYDAIKVYQDKKQKGVL